jgi:PHP family Zn ribbon phosphoesterase
MTHGSRFCKTDLHVHTPASHDYKDRAAIPMDILNAAAATGIDILAVTDHNSADFVDKMRAASQETSATVIPGVEITTPEGHILALFEAKTSESDITDLLIRIGIPRAKHGQEEAISKGHAEEVIREIHGMHGVAIAAHANEKNIGLLQAKGQYKMAVVPMRELAALEFTKQGDVERFSTGIVSPNYPAKACTQSSDAHSLAEIGQRITYLKMQERSAYGISQALLDYESRVRFPWNLPNATHPRILKLKVDQGFFADEEFFLSRELELPRRRPRGRQVNRCRTPSLLFQ